MKIGRAQAPFLLPSLIFLSFPYPSAPLRSRVPYWGPIDELGPISKILEGSPLRIDAPACLYGMMTMLLVIVLKYGIICDVIETYLVKSSLCSDK